MSNSFIPYGHQSVDDDDVAAVLETLTSDWLTTGPKIAELEAAVKSTVEAKHAVACASGSAALHLAAIALESGPALATIVPSLTFLATANAVRLAGGEVVFADVDPSSGLMTAESLSAAISRAKRDGVETHSVTPGHLTGRCCDMIALESIAHDNGLRVVEDAAHAFGATYAHAGGGCAPVGDCRHSDLTTFSFHPVKSITTGEGGLVTTNDERLAEKLRTFRNHGIERDVHSMRNRDMAFDCNGSPNPWYHEMHTLAPNYRLTDIQCALGLTQLKKLKRFIQTRRAVAERYDRLLAPFSPSVTLLSRPGAGESSWHLYPVLIDFESVGITRARVMNALRQEGIGTQVHYIPVHHQPYYRERYGELDLPGADAYYARTLSLPIYPDLTSAEQDRVVESLVEILGLEAKDEEVG